MSSTQLGRNLPASPHRQSDAEYVTDRNLDVLKQVGVPEETLQIMRDADSIPAAQGTTGPDAPVEDGTLTLTELDRLDQPGDAAVLWEGQRNRIAAAHDLYKVPAATQVTVEPLPPMVTYERQAAPAEDVTTLKLEDMSPADRAAAGMFQRLEDSDHNPATITNADLDNLQRHSASLPGRVTQRLQAMERRFGTRGGEERVIGRLQPFEHSQRLFEAGGARLSLVTKQEPTIEGSSWRRSLSRNFATRFLRVEAPEGTRVMLKQVAVQSQRRASFDERAFGAGAHEQAFSNGEKGVWCQVFDAQGTMIGNAMFKIPALSFQPEPEAAQELRGQQVTTWIGPDGQEIPARSLQDMLSLRPTGRRGGMTELYVPDPNDEE